MHIVYFIPFILIYTFSGNGFPKYGGVGGQGGCVYFVATDDVSLKDVSKKYENSLSLSEFELNKRYTFCFQK